MTAPAAGFTAGAWGLFELGLLARDRRRGLGATDRDRGTRMLIRAALYVAFGVAIAAPPALPSAAIHGRAWLVGAGLVLMWSGLVVRVWAVATLGPAFRTTVEVDPGQAIVGTGPYRWVRHPAYTGIALVVTGFGVASGNWVAAAVCALLPLAALVRRIRVEEAELTRVLGDRYVAYRAGTKRLLPGLW